MKFIKADTKILFGSDLKPLSRLVLVGRRYFDRGNGRGCFAKKETIAEMMGMSLHQLRRGLKELADKDYICIERNGQGRADTIWLTNIEENEVPEVKKIKAPTLSHRSTSIEVEHNDTSNDVDKDKNTCLTTPNIEDPPIDLKATEECHKRLQDYLTYAKWEKWFSDSWVIEENSQALTIFVPKPYVADYINTAFKSAIEVKEGKKMVIFGVRAAGTC